MKTIGYVRVSTDKRAEHGVSLEAQEAKMRALATVHGTELSDVIVDGGESAKSLNRPGMAKLLATVDACQVETVIIDSLFIRGVLNGNLGSGAAARTCEDYLLKDVIPTVEVRYRVSPGRENRAIAGLSMGGGQSLRIGLGHLDLFSSVASFSGAVPADFETRFAALLKDSKGTNERIKTFFVGCGQQDSIFARSKNLADLLTKYQVTHIFHPIDGVHNYTVWRKYLAEYAPLLFR